MDFKLDKARSKVVLSPWVSYSLSWIVFTASEFGEIILFSDYFQKLDLALTSY